MIKLPVFDAQTIEFDRLLAGLKVLFSGFHKPHADFDESFD
jgi:hypothetical protein